MQAWIGAAADYVGAWVAHQMREMDTPGAVLAIADGEHLVYERAYGAADLHTGEAMTGRHRFRVASLSKTFTAVGVLKLAEAGRLGLDTASLRPQAEMGARSLGLRRPLMSWFSQRRRHVDAACRREDLLQNRRELMEA